MMKVRMRKRVSVVRMGEGAGEKGEDAEDCEYENDCRKATEERMETMREMAESSRPTKKSQWPSVSICNQSNGSLRQIPSRG